MQPVVSDATPDHVTELLQKGIAAARAKQPQKARALLLQVIEHDQANISAWLWLSGVLDDIEEQEICLQNVLTLDPANEIARKGLALLQRQKQEQPPPAVETVVPLQPVKPAVVTPKSPKSAGSKYKRLSPNSALRQTQASEQPTKPQATGWFEKPAHARRAASPASGLLYGQRESIIEPIEDNSQHNDVFGNEYLCPYCAHQTRPEDKKCKACRGNLWFAVPRRAKPSKLFKVLVIMQIINALGGLGQILQLIIAATEQDLPLSLVVPFIFGMIIGHTIMLVGLFKRWRLIFYLYIVQTVFGLGAAFVLALILGLGLNSGGAAIFCGGSLILIMIFQLFLVFNLGEDFTSDKYRVFLRVDADVKTGPNLLERGNFYAKKKMWALAAVHFRQAAYQLSNQLAPHLALAVAYNNLKMYDKMIEPLARAKALNPNDPGVQKLSKLVDKRHR